MDTIQWCINFTSLHYAMLDKSCNVVLKLVSSWSSCYKERLTNMKVYWVRNEVYAVKYDREW